MKKVVLILIPLLLIGGGGGAYFAATKGMITIPGVTPAKKKNTAAGLYGEQQDPKFVEAEKKKLDEEAAKLKKEEADKLKELEAKKPKPEAGYKTVAKLWSTMNPEALIATTADWKPEDLAPIFVTMDPELVSAFLSKLSEKEAKRASLITRAIQTKASEPKV